VEPLNTQYLMIVPGDNIATALEYFAHFNEYPLERAVIIHY
jgi:hypothetical protein